jgi:hypothetical protein
MKFQSTHCPNCDMTKDKDTNLNIIGDHIRCDWCDKIFIVDETNTVFYEEEA